MKGHSRWKRFSKAAKPKRLERSQFRWKGEYKKKKERRKQCGQRGRLIEVALVTLGSENGNLRTPSEVAHVTAVAGPVTS